MESSTGLGCINMKGSSTATSLGGKTVWTIRCSANDNPWKYKCYNEHAVLQFNLPFNINIQVFLASIQLYYYFLSKNNSTVKVMFSANI